MLRAGLEGMWVLLLCQQSVDQASAFVYTIIDAFLLYQVGDCGYM